MYCVYFIFVGYRVAIGRTKNIFNRIGSYQRTHREVEVLGIIKCDSKDEYMLTEREVIKFFQDDNDFRDMFFLSKHMRDWIINNTIPMTDEILSKCLESNRKQKDGYMQKYLSDPEIRERHLKNSRDRYHNNPEVREQAIKRGKERYQENKNDPDFRAKQREYERELYQNNPEYRRKTRERQRKYYARKRRKSDATLSISFDS